MPQVIRDIMNNELLQWARQIPRVELSICAGLLKHEKSSVIDLIDTKALTQNWKTLGSVLVRGWNPHPSLPAKKHTKYAYREFESLPDYHETLVRATFKLSAQ
jgi:hypothetical protein